MSKFFEKLKTFWKEASKERAKLTLTEKTENALRKQGYGISVPVHRYVGEMLRQIKQEKTKRKHKRELDLAKEGIEKDVANVKQRLECGIRELEKMYGPK